jgi:hypothetical protein
MVITSPKVLTNTSSSGVLTSNQSQVISTLGAGAVSIGVTGTWIGQLQFEASVDGTTWLPVTAYQVLPTGPGASGTSVNGNWNLPVSGFSTFRVRAATVSSGLANIFLNATQAGPSIQPIIIDTSAAALSVLHNEIALVASGVEATVLTLTAATVPLKIQRVEVSGENVALYRLKISGTTIHNKRSWWGNFNQTFELSGGLLLQVGQILTVTALHNRPNLSNFEATVLY